MKQEKPVRILGTGKYLPEAIASSVIEQRYGLPEGWSEKFSGVKNRHHATFESNGYMGARALEEALANASLDLDDIDLLISAGGTYDYPLPNQACIIKSELKNGNELRFGTIDVDSTCLSFVTAFEIATRLLDGDQYKKIAIVSSEIASKGLNPANKETISLFGDAAAAVIVGHDPDGRSALIRGGQINYSDGVEDTIIRGGGNKFFFRDHPYNAELHSFEMNGIKLLKMAKKRIPEFIDWFFKDVPVKFSEVDIIIPHQASKTGLEIFMNQYPFLNGQVQKNLERCGNCIAASIPLVLHETITAGKIKRGDTILMTGTSAGFSIGGVLVRY